MIGVPLPQLPRLGFLGVGWIGRHRMQALADSGVCEVAAIADTNPEVACQAASGVSGVLIRKDLGQLLEMDLDGVVIATPSALHAEQSIRALEAGKAVFCQKPLARSAEETRQVVEAAKHADRLLSVDLSYRYVEGVIRVRDLIRSGELGRIYAADLVFHNAYGPDKSWFYQRHLAGGGCVTDLGIHLIDLVLWMLDFPPVEAVNSRCYVAGQPLDLSEDTVEDYATAQLILATGTTVQLACSWRLPAGCDADIRANFYGTGGGVAVRNIDGSFYDFEALRFRGTARERLAAPPDAWGGRAIVAWARQLACGNCFNPEIERMVQVAEVIEAIYRM